VVADPFKALADVVPEMWGSAITSLKEGLGIPDNPRNLGEVMAHIVKGKPGQMYHRFLETPIGEQQDATITEADYKPKHLDIMREMARVAMADGRYHTSYDKNKDYDEMVARGYPYTWGSDLAEIGHTLGGYRFDIRDGKVYATDEYNFNQYDLEPKWQKHVGLFSDASSTKEAPYSRQALRNALEASGWSTKRNFPWWDAFQAVFPDTPWHRETGAEKAILGRLYSPPFEDTTIPVDINLGTVSDVYGPMHYRNKPNTLESLIAPSIRPTGGIIGR
jgi:hypothetical protein